MKTFKITGDASRIPDGEDYEVCLDNENLVVTIDEDDYQEESIRMIPNYSSPYWEDYKEESFVTTNEDAMMRDAYKIAEAILKDEGYVNWDMSLAS